MSFDMHAGWTFPGCPEPPAWKLDFESLVARFDWLEAMRTCEQDSQWHAEGNVLTHVGMVCAELTKLEAWRALPALERQMVFAGALLHDVAKPDVTKEEDGRVRSKGHALRGAMRSRRILATLGTPFEVREAIVGIVRYHGLPAYFLDRPDPLRSVVTASIIARLDLVTILAHADARGRICLGHDDAGERIELFREFAVEHHCWGTPYPFWNDHSRFTFFRQSEGTPDVQRYDDTRLKVTVMSGLPASGKDTWIKHQMPETPVVSLDDLRGTLRIDPGDDQTVVVSAAKEKAKIHLCKRQGFVWNATNTGRMLRDSVITLCAAYGAHVRIIYCEAPLDKIDERNSKRERPVPQSVIERLVAHLEVPDLTEAHEVVYVIS